MATPIARLAHMNPDAIRLYADHGIDLYREPLRVAVCAQHANGGVSVDASWQTTIHGLYAAGECAGTFGIYRPGGSALNSTQVGSMRAAEHIATSTDEKPFDAAEFQHAAEQIEPWLKKMLETVEHSEASSRSYQILEQMQKRMSECAAHLRNKTAMTSLEEEIEKTLGAWTENYIPAAEGGFAQMLRIRDTMMTQAAVLSAMRRRPSAAAARVWCWMKTVRASAGRCRSFAACRAATGEPARSLSPHGRTAELFRTAKWSARSRCATTGSKTCGTITGSGRTACIEFFFISAGRTLPVRTAFRPL